MAMLNNQRLYIYMTSHAQNGITIKASLPLNCVEECWLGKLNSRLLVAHGGPTATWKKRGEPTALVDGGLQPDNSTLFLVIYLLQMAILYTLNCQRVRPAASSLDSCGGWTPLHVSASNHGEMGTKSHAAVMTSAGPFSPFSFQQNVVTEATEVCRWKLCIDLRSILFTSCCFRTYP